MRLRGATSPHRQFLLILERPRELTEPNRASRHPDRPPTPTVASTSFEPVRGRRGSRHFAQLSGGTTPGFAAGGCSVFTGALSPPAVGRFVLVVVTAPAVFGSASGFSTVPAETPRPSQRSPSRYRPPAGTSDRSKASQCPALQYRVSPGRSRALTTPTRPPSGYPSFVGVPRQPQPAPFPFVSGRGPR